MPTAFVGETRLPKNFKRYARQFSLLELDCEPGNIPGKARLAAVAEAAPEGFVFSLLVPSRLASLESCADVEAAWKAAQNVARLLGAKWWVVRTPAEVRPTRRSREALAALVQRLGEGGMRVAWSHAASGTRAPRPTRRLPSGLRSSRTSPARCRAPAACSTRASWPWGRGLASVCRSRI